MVPGQASSISFVFITVMWTVMGLTYIWLLEGSLQISSALEVHVFIRPYSKDLSPLPEYEANHYKTGNFCAEQCALSQCYKATGSVLSVVTLIGIISFLISEEGKGEEGREKMSCLCNSPLLTKLVVLCYSSENEKKNIQRNDIKTLSFWLAGMSNCSFQ